MVRSGLVVLLLAAGPVLAEERPAPPAPRTASGTFTHGDSSGFFEEAYGGVVERPPPEADPAARKRDPGLRWDGPGVGR